MNTLNGYMLAAFLAIVVAVGIAGYRVGGNHARVEAQVVMDAHLAADREQERLATEAARTREQEMLELQNKVAQEYERGKQNAEIESQRIVAELRSGVLRLRKQWDSCQTGDLPGTATTPGQSNATTGYREESAGRIIRAADECDAQVTGLQDILKQR
jgi:hypothetical protein